MPVCLPVYLFQKHVAFTTSFPISSGLTLPLLVLGVFTDNPDYPAPFHDLALFTSDFYGSFYFHNLNLYFT